MKKDLEDGLLKTFKISSKDGETVKIFRGGRAVCREENTSKKHSRKEYY